MRRLSALMQVLVLALIAVGCAGGAGQPGDRDQPGSTPEFAFPTPAELQPLIDQPRRPSYTEGDLVRLGKDYDVGFPSGEVLVSGNSLGFNAAWAPGQGLTGLAFCIYAFTIPDYDRAPEIHTTWSVNPSDNDSVFFGLANWDTQRWDWFAADVNPLTLPSFDPYRDPSDDMLLAVAVIDSGTPVLDKVQLGPPPSIGEWLHSWGSDADDYFVSAATNHENAVYFAGTTGSYGLGGSDGLVVGFDLEGNWTWGEAWGGTDEDSFSEVAVGDGGEVYTVGTTSSTGQGAGDVLIVGWSFDGIIEFARAWGTAEAEQGVAMALSGPYLYILATTVQETTGQDLLLLKFDTGPNQTLWARYFGGDFDDFAGSICVTQPEPGTDLLHMAFNLGISNSDSDVAYCTLDANGNIVSQQRWDNAAYDLQVSDIALTGAPNSQVFISGYANTDELGEDMFLLEYDAAPGYVARAWAVATDGTTRANALAVDLSGNLVLAGYASDIGSFNSGLVARISPAGMLLGAEAVVSASADVMLSELVVSPGYGSFITGRMAQSDDSAWQSAVLNPRDLSGNWTGTTLGSDALPGTQAAGDPGTFTVVLEADVDAGGGQVDGLVGLVIDP